MKAIACEDFKSIKELNAKFIGEMFHNDNENDNDNENILFEHNIQIYITDLQ